VERKMPFDLDQFIADCRAAREEANAAAKA
jgi:hypothetical protein